MSWRKVKRDPADAAFSNYIRYRDGWRCKRCSKQFEVGAQNFHNSHFWSRGRESTRFDPENCDGLCSYCHEYLGKNPEEHRAWKLKQIGQDAYDRLMVRANTSQKRDRKLALIICKKLAAEEKARFEETGY